MDYNSIGTRKSKVSSIVSMAVALLVLVGFLVAYPVAYRMSASEETIVVTNKERVLHKETSKYLVFSSGETYEVTDSWLFLRFDSSDTYGKLEKDKTYEVLVAGWRVPFLSWYRNIIEAQPKE